MIKKTTSATKKSPISKKPKAPKRPTVNSAEDNALLDLAKVAAQTAYDTKGFDIQVLDLRKLSGFTDYFVIISGRSDRQVRSIAEKIEVAMKKHHMRQIGSEGFDTSHWILLDYGTIVVHVFFEETRTFYDIENLWGDAPRIRLKLT